MFGERWTPEDIEHLEELIGDLPLALVARKHRVWARANGRPERTVAAVLTMVKKRGLRCRATGAWITTGTIAACLGFRPARVTDWIRRTGGDQNGLRGQLQARHFPLEELHRQRKRKRGTRRRPYWWVSREDLRAFALDNPRLFTHLDRPSLVELLDDERTADHVIRQAKTVRGPWRRVRCVETGVVYQSMAHAARDVFVVRNTLRRAARTGGSAGGFHWELL